MHRVNNNNNKTINKSQVINDMHTHTHTQQWDTLDIE